MALLMPSRTAPEYEAYPAGLSRAASETVTVDYATSDGTATAGADYTSTSAPGGHLGGRCAGGGRRRGAAGLRGHAQPGGGVRLHGRLRHGGRQRAGGRRYRIRAGTQARTETGVREPGTQAQVGSDVAEHDPLGPVRGDGDGPADRTLQPAGHRLESCRTVVQALPLGGRRGDAVVARAGERREAVGDVRGVARAIAGALPSEGAGTWLQVQSQVVLCGFDNRGFDNH